MLSRTALILGGTGQIGRAAATLLAGQGWRVTIAQRHDAPAPLGGSSLVMDRDEPGAVARAVGKGVDALIDTVAYDAGHARQLLQVQDRVGAFVVVSSASVYRDDLGRTLDEARETGAPVFPVPIAEDQPTVAPGPATYSTRKIALESALRDGARRPVTILRPGAIHGPGSSHPREWFFIKRLLDGRAAVPLAWDGASRFHTTATANIAALISVVLDNPGTEVLNVADPEALTVSQIGKAISAAYGKDLRLVPFSGPPTRAVGGHPWCIANPIVLDTRRAAALGFASVTSYAAAMAQTCRSIESVMAAGTVVPAYLLSLFDYAAEDAWMAERNL